MDPGLPLMLVLGGSQGAARLNSFVIDNIETLLQSFQVFHQTGAAHLSDAKLLLTPVIERLPASLKGKYRLGGVIDAPTLKTALTAADIVISRSGAGTISEIALAGVPALLVPLPGSANGHQLMNAEEYAASGAAVVIEEGNLTPHIVLGEAKRVLETPDVLTKMRSAARSFAKPDAAKVIAEELLKLAGA
jgi:UDP-N-acetylglucosamine--N-acetylmuramyl-(pentapeptide) pyrophosphoryl-undecaprenol N-acetylglucosamine transferase